MGPPSVVSFEALCSFTVFWFATSVASLASMKGAPYWAVPTDHLAAYPLALLGMGGGLLLAREKATGWWFTTCTWNTVRAPAVPVTFKETYIADQITSLTIVIRFAAVVVSQ
jgi:hypothetical protein